MKRLIFIASLAMLAVGCQKTEIQNEVLTPIGFSTEIGKQTRAIVDNPAPAQDGSTPTLVAHPTTQPFAVYAYGHQGNAAATTVMDNVEVSYQTDTWKATSGSYYWPNDHPSTTLNFYAFSPYIQRPATQSVTASAAPTATDADKIMTVTSLSHTENGGLVFEGYNHTNMYVDFMEATSVIGAKYSDPDGLQNNNSVTSGTVPMTFNHMMTQVLFKVTTDELYPGITFTVESITLNNVNNQGSYNDGTWTPEGSGTYIIFPANNANGANAKNPLNTVDDDQTTNVDERQMEAEIALTNEANATVNASMTTTGVIMIPQDLIASTTGDAAVNGQSFTIVYRIAGTGVASETVTKTVDLYKDASTTINWEASKKITYTVKIGLKEILFEPSVANWTPETGNEYTFQQ